MDREKVIEGLRCIKGDLILCVNCAYSDENGHGTHSCKACCANDAIALLKEQEDLLGIQQTADSITFISTGTAKQGEERGIMLGKSWMHERLKKELLHRGLLTDEIRSIFDEAKRI